jgi:hypothetical protein
MIVSRHEELVQALPAEKGKLSRSLRTLEERGWLVIGRSGLEHGVGHFRLLSITQQRHLLAYHFMAMRHEGL